MNGEWFPRDIGAAPWWENIPLLQFAHRWLAKILVVLYFLWWLKARHTPLAKFSSAALILVMAQVALGVATLLMQVPLPLALAHQLTALALFAITVAALHRQQKCNRAWPPCKENIKV